MSDKQEQDDLIPTKWVGEFDEEVNGANEWVKARNLVGGPSFNIVAASERENTYNKKTTQEFVFEIQFAEGENRGARANMSLQQDQSRARIYAALRRHGPHGPYWMLKTTTKGGATYYKLSTGAPGAGDQVDLSDDDEEIPF